LLYAATSSHFPIGGRVVVDIRAAKHREPRPAARRKPRPDPLGAATLRMAGADPWRNV